METEPLLENKSNLEKNTGRRSEEWNLGKGGRSGREAEEHEEMRKGANRNGDVDYMRIRNIQRIQFLLVFCNSLDQA